MRSLKIMITIVIQSSLTHCVYVKCVLENNGNDSHSVIIDIILYVRQMRVRKLFTYVCASSNVKREKQQSESYLT